MRNHYNCAEFVAHVNGNEYRFEAYTTNTRNGFCHTVVSLDYNTTETKVSYLNRTWERFRYETALSRAIDKFPKAMQPALTRQLIDRVADDEKEKAEGMFNSFKSLHDGLNDENKKRLADSGIMVQSESDARAVMGLMALMTLFQG